MLRHAKDYQLANEGIDTRAIQGYLGHRNIQNTLIYTKHNANRTGPKVLVRICHEKTSSACSRYPHINTGPCR
jgi:site-specific recombinase XerD